jgi:hypothetical protein
MKKNFLDSIDVKSPCSESWDEMTGNDEIRFCAHCAKDVHNLSAMNRIEAEKLVRQSNGGICIRIEKNPSGKSNAAPPKPVQIKRRATFAAGVLAASLTLATVSYAQGEAIVPKDNSKQSQKNKSAKPAERQVFSIISGQITDESGLMIPGAKITLRDLKTGKIRVTESNFEGFYEFADVEPAVYEIEIAAFAFEKLILKDIELSENTQLTKVFVLKPAVVIGVVSTSTEITTDSDLKPTSDVQQRQIEDLPRNQRTFTLGLIALPPNEKTNKKKNKKN